MSRLVSARSSSPRPWCSVIILVLHLLQCCYGYPEHYVEDECSKGSFAITLASEEENSVAILRATRHISYRDALDCMIELVPPTKCGIVISVRRIDLRTQLVGVCQDHIEIYGGPTGSGAQLYSGCSSLQDVSESKSFSAGNAMSVKYHTDPKDLSNATFTGYFGFQFTITAYHSDDALKNDTNFFNCNNGKIVWRGLLCDGHNNCGDLSDESTEGPFSCIPPRSHVIYIVAGGVLAGSFSITSITFLVFRKKKRRQRLRTLLRARREMISPNIQHSLIS